jgi:hypothetical protein
MPSPSPFRLRLHVCAVVLATLITMPLRAATSVSGTLSSHTTWTLAGSPYQVTGNVVVPADVVLTVEAGVRVEFTGAHSIVVAGAIVAEGAFSSVDFVSTTAGTSSGATMLSFQGANLNLSKLHFVKMFDADRAILIGGNSDCSGTLKVTNGQFVRSEVRMGGAGRLELKDSAVISATISQAAGGGEIDLLTGTFSEARVEASSSLGRIRIVNGAPNNTDFVIGCCGARFEIVGGYFVKSPLQESGTANSQLLIDATTFANSQIDLPNVRVDMRDSSISFAGGVVPRVVFASGTITRSTLQGEGAGGTALEFTQGAAAGAIDVNRTTIERVGTAIKLTGNSASHVYTIGPYNNFLQITGYTVENRTTASVSAPQNYWGTTTTNEIANRIFDQNDDPAFGPVVVSGSLSGDPQPPNILKHPLPISAPQGTTATFEVDARGSPAPTYVWHKDGAPIPTATAAALTLGSVQPADAGTYTVVVSNALGSVTSQGAVLTVTAPNGHPSVTKQPETRHALAGEAITFTVEATGLAPLNYQWRRNGVAISGATSASFAISSVQTADAGDYTVVVSNSIGSVTSLPAVLTVAANPTLPVITSHPVNQWGTEGGSATFSVVAVGHPSPSYQWFKDGNALASSNTPNLTLSHLKAGDAGTYHVRVSNTVGSVTSNGALLTVVPAGTAPAFVRHPASQTVAIGATVVFTAEASGNPAPAYSWRKDGAILVGETAPTLTIQVKGPENAGSYVAVATNAAGTVESQTAVLTVSQRSRLANISTRGFVGSGEQAMIAGFYVGGTQARSVLIRAVGPSLEKFGLDRLLAQPKVDLMRGQTVLLENVGWMTSPEADKIPTLSAQVGAFALLVGAADSALVATLEPGPYTALVRGQEGGTGTGLVEVYQIGNAHPGLVNISTRAWVGTGDRVLIAGVVVVGPTPVSVLVRAVGPALKNFGLNGYLEEPHFTVYRDDKIVAQGAGRIDTPELLDATARAGAFALPEGSKDAAIVLNLQPGNHTIIVRGVGNTTGLALVELYELP